MLNKILSAKVCVKLAIKTNVFDVLFSYSNVYFEGELK